jgi:uncharacterized protein (DUF885 family)
MYTNFTQLSDEQINKLSWNRLKNIMKPIRALISSINSNHGVTMFILDERFNDDRDARDREVKQILQPLNEYFAKLKLAASKLPHEVSRNRKAKQRVYLHS